MIVRSRFLVAIVALATVGLVTGCDSNSGEKSVAAEAAAAQQLVEAERQRLSLEAERLRLAQAAEMQRAAEEAERIRVTTLWRNCVQEVINADAAIPSGLPAASVASQMMAIDTTSCPPDFREAFLAHTQAWENAGRISASLEQLNSDENTGRTLGAQFFASLFETGDTPYRDHADADRRLRQARTAASEEIRATYDAVERVSVRYGAVLPASG